MSYRGMMDGWNGDENECNGTCGLCDYCDDLHLQRCDDDYEQWRDESEEAA